MQSQLHGYTARRRVTSSVSSTQGVKTQVCYAETTLSFKPLSFHWLKEVAESLKWRWKMLVTDGISGFSIHLHLGDHGAIFTRV